MAERRFFAEIIVDDTNAFEENGIGPCEYLEREFGWLQESGISLENAIIADDDEDSMWMRYLHHLIEWAMEKLNSEEPENPLLWEQYKEKEKPHLIMVEDFHCATKLIEDLGNGVPTQNGERTSTYHTVAKGRNTDADKTCDIALVERDGGYYELHIVDNIRNSDCKLLCTQTKYPLELQFLLKSVLGKIERGENL